MKFALFFVLCLAFALVVESFLVEEALGDEAARHGLHPFRRCRRDKHCKDDECCFRGRWLFRRGYCKPKRREGWFCHPKFKCLSRCQDDLECRDWRCRRPVVPTPTEEPGSGMSGDHDVSL